MDNKDKTDEKHYIIGWKKCPQCNNKVSSTDKLIYCPCCGWTLKRKL